MSPFPRVILAVLLSLGLLARLTSPASSDDPYEVLGVPREASQAEIRSAFRAKALETHPDKNQGREEEAADDFRRVAGAYELLSDDARRADFDRDATGWGADGADGQGAPFKDEPNWWHREVCVPTARVWWFLWGAGGIIHDRECMASRERDGRGKHRQVRRVQRRIGGVDRVEPSSASSRLERCCVRTLCHH